MSNWTPRTEMIVKMIAQDTTRVTSFTFKKNIKIEETKQQPIDKTHPTTHPTTPFNSPVVIAKCVNLQSVDEFQLNK